MARVTVEDCLEQVPSRFRLVVMTSVRTKQLMRGAKSLVSAGENRSVVTALREVAAGLVKPDVEPEGPPSELEPEAETAED